MTDQHDRDSLETPPSGHLTGNDASSVRRRLAEALTPDEGTAHEQVEKALPSFVADELLGRNVARLYPSVHRHLLHCDQCASLHVDLLRDFSADPEDVDVGLPDLSFLVPTISRSRIASPAMTLDAAKHILTEVWPKMVNQLDIVADVFFHEIERIGKPFALQSGYAQALGYGGDTPIALKVLAATFKANQDIQEGMMAQPEFDFDKMRSEIEYRAARAALDAGLGKKERKEFVDAYMIWLSQHTV